MNHEPLVPINTGTPEEIATLHHIGPTLAKRIVEHRESFGFFYGPEDLAKIEGVSLDLARTLAPHIDWQASTDVDEMPSRWWGLLGVVVTALLCFLFAVFRVPDLVRAYSTSERGLLPGLLNISRATAAALIPLAMTLWIAYAAVAWLTMRRDSRVVDSLRKVFKPLFPALFCCTVSGVIMFIADVAHIVAYHRGLPVNTPYQPVMVGSALIVAVTFVLVWPIAIMYWRPELLRLPIVGTFLATGFLTLSLASAAAIWIWGGEQPAWAVLLMLVLGSSCMWIAISALRAGGSAIQEVLGLILDLVAPAQSTRRDYWLTWINEQLPSPQHQKALRDVLNRAYPASRTETLLNLLAIGIGGWLVVTAIDAVIEWIVQGWLEKLLK